ncbi:MAG: hypothetical protein AAFQ82_06760 [Myxococcota bacterium]
MDELTQRLKEDAQAFDANVSDELARRIQGSLEMTRPEPPPRKARPVEWWAAILGLGTAIAVGALILLNSPNRDAQPLPVNRPITLTFPKVEPSQAESAMVDPLHQELGHLLADLSRAQRVLGIGFESRQD